MLAAVDPSRLPGDRRGFLDINGWARHTAWLHGVLTDYATYGVVLFALLLLAGWWVARSRGPRAMAAALWAPIGMLLAVLVNQPIASSVGERRPFVVFPHALTLVQHSTDPGFASDHATMAGAVAAMLTVVAWRLGAAAWAAALVLAFARVYVGVHFPVDVVTGLALGAVVSLVGWVLLARPLTALVVRLAGTPLRPLLATA